MIVYETLEIIYPMIMWAFIILVCLKVIKWVFLVMYGCWLDIFDK